MKISPLANENNLRIICNQSKNAVEVLEKFNLKPSSGNYTTLKKYLRKFEIIILGYGKFRKSKRKKKYEDAECFSENSEMSRVHVKKRIIANNLIPYKCVVCNLGSVWNNKPISLQLEHKNGINNDNRLQNLAFICPNCHSQTDTYAGKNKNKNTLLV